MRLLGNGSTHVVEVLHIRILSCWVNFFLFGLGAIFKFIWILNTFSIFFGLLIIALGVQQRVGGLSTPLLLRVVNAVWVSACDHGVYRGERHGNVEFLDILGIPRMLDDMEVERAFWASLNSMRLYSAVLRPPWNRALRRVLNTSQRDAVLVYVVGRWLIPPTVLIGWNISIGMDRCDVNRSILFIF